MGISTFSAFADQADYSLLRALRSDPDATDDEAAVSALAPC